VIQLGNVITIATGREPVAYYGAFKLTRLNAHLSRWPLMLPEYPMGNRFGHYATLVTVLGPVLPPGRASSWPGRASSWPGRAPICLDGARPYDFHQYTPAGRVGSLSPVDRSIWVGTIDTLREWYAGTLGKNAK
jgi:hypothetical protein